MRRLLDIFNFVTNWVRDDCPAWAKWSLKIELAILLTLVLCRAAGYI
jgi:hypothetical protein